MSNHAQACDAAASDHLIHSLRGAIYKHFGYHKSPLNVVVLHSGVDYRGHLGARIVATEAGTVVAAGRYGGYGNYVRIDHGKGLQTTYAHMRHIKVKRGQCAAEGETIGSVGQSGIAIEPHLHFEVISDKGFVDPLPFLPIRG